MSGIQVENLHKAFNNFKAVDGVTFTVNEGELAVLLGPSGSGKSTILRIIAGLERPDTGSILLTGEDVTFHRTQKRNIGFVFQHYALFKHMTVWDNIAFGMRVRKREESVIHQKVSELIDLVKLTGYEKRYPSQLSGGQRQRVALARALAPEPSILLLDEPFGALDAKVRENLADWLCSLHRQIAITTILVTHDQKEAIEIADKIIVVNRGRIEQIGSPREVYENPQTKFVASFIGQTNVLSTVVRNGQLFLGETLIPHQGQTLPADSEMIVLLARPEDISVHKDSCQEKGELQGVIHHIHYRGNIYDMDIQVGGNMIKTCIGKEEFQKQNLSQGDSVYLCFRDLTFFNAPEGGESEIRKQLAQLGYIE